MKIKILLSALLTIILFLTLPLIPAVQYDTIVKEQKKHAYDILQNYVRETLTQSIKIDKNNKDQPALFSDNPGNTARLIQPLKWILHILVKILFLPLKIALKIMVKLIFLPLKIVLLPLKILFLPVTLFLFPLKLMIKTFLFILKIITLPPRLIANIVSLLTSSRDTRRTCTY